MSVGTVLHWARRNEEAMPWFRRVLEMEPGSLRAHWGLGLALAQSGSSREAAAELEKSVALSDEGPAFLGSLGYVYATSDRRPAAEEIVRKLEERSKTGYVPASTVAIILAGLAEKDQALAWLERANEERDPWITTLRINFMFDALRSDPRFQDLLRRVGLG
jgi:Flp pilus assembly protein TadD